MTPVLTSELQKESPVKQERLKQNKKTKKQPSIKVLGEVQAYWSRTQVAMTFSFL